MLKSVFQTNTVLYRGHSITLKMILGWFVFSFLTLFLNVVLPIKSFALNEKQFQINYDISYVIKENGETEVEQQVFLVNLKNDVVPTNYSFTLKQVKVFDVSAEANGKKVNVETSDDENGSSFTVPVTNYSIGKDKQNKITVRYKTNDIASKTGNVWYVFIPKINVPDTTEKYDVKVQVPDKFGGKLFFSPVPMTEKKEGTNTLFYLNKNAFEGTGITAAFGTSQIINFDLKYQVENTGIFYKRFSIPLPPNIKNYQEVAYTKIDPKPIKITLDADGNPMALYILPSKKKLEIDVTGSAKVFPNQINTEYGGSFLNIPKDLIKKYTGAEKFWDAKSQKIIDKAKSLKNESLNVSKNARLVYNFVIENLTYDFDASKKDFVERQGGEIALTQKGSWTCMEFTDLFIALARAEGIPAREVNGYAINGKEVSKPLALNLKNGDFLHAWAEFYDPNFGWVQVDPTWGNTSGIDYFSKLDTNHLTLVRRGVDSESPLPAGAYRFEDGKKLIEIDFSEQTNTEIFTPKLEAKKALNLNLLEIIKGHKKYVVKNIGNSFVYTPQGKVIPPEQSVSIYENKDSNTLLLSDTNGNTVSINP